MLIKFKGKIWRTGTGFVVTIPAAYMKNKLLLEETEYEFEVCDDAN